MNQPGAHTPHGVEGWPCRHMDHCKSVEAELRQELIRMRLEMAERGRERDAAVRSLQTAQLQWGRWARLTMEHARILKQALRFQLSCHADTEQAPPFIEVGEEPLEVPWLGRRRSDGEQPSP